MGQKSWIFTFFDARKLPMPSRACGELFCIALGLHYRWIRLLRRPQSRLGKNSRKSAFLHSLLNRVATFGNINSSKLGWLSPSSLATRQC